MIVMDGSLSQNFLFNNFPFYTHKKVAKFLVDECGASRQSEQVAKNLLPYNKCKQKVLRKKWQKSTFIY